MRKINKIIVHCTDTPENREVPVEEIRRWHVEERGWSDIGYHYVIDLQGEIHEGRDIERTGAHCKGHNFHSIGIAYVGGKREGKPADTRTEAQKDGLETILQYLKILYPSAVIFGHRDFSEKQCPCFDAKTEYKFISEA